MQSQIRDTSKLKRAIHQRREFHLKLAVALALFIVFWTVGAAVFQATECECWV